MSPLKTVATSIAAAASCLVLAASSAAAHAVTCSTHGLPAAGKGVAVTALSATGIGCGKAASVARSVTRDIEQGRAISIPGSAGLSMAETTSCTGCPMHTQLTLLYPDGGAVRMVLKGGSAARPGSGPGSMTVPFPKIPGFPWPKIPGFPPDPTAQNGSGSTVV